MDDQTAQVPAEFRLTVHPGTLDVTVEVQLRPGEPRP
jgi:hypothetical protein